MTEPGSSFGLGDEGRRAVAEVMATPVGRRWVLRPGLAGAAAAVLAESAGGVAVAAPAANGAAKKDRSVERLTLHFVLGAAASLPGLVVHALGAEVPLVPHTPATRKKLRSQGIVFSEPNTGLLTHYAEVELPADRGLPVTVYGQRGGVRVVLLQSFHAPTKGLRTFALAARRLEGSYRSVLGSPTRTARLGLDPKVVHSPNEAIDFDHIVEASSTAVTMVMMHPNVATIDPIAVPVTKALVGLVGSVGSLGDYISAAQGAGETGRPRPRCWTGPATRP